jgi:hypothetical protein
MPCHVSSLLMKLVLVSLVCEWLPCLTMFSVLTILVLDSLLDSPVGEWLPWFAVFFAVF